MAIRCSTFGMSHFVRDATPGEAHRRTVRHLRDRLDRLGPLEQPDRPRRQKTVLQETVLFKGLLREIVRRAGHLLRAMHRHRKACEFGDMGVPRQEPLHAVGAEARHQPVDQMRDLARVRT